MIWILAFVSGSQSSPDRTLTTGVFSLHSFSRNVSRVHFWIKHHIFLIFSLPGFTVGFQIGLSHVPRVGVDLVFGFVGVREGQTVFSVWTGTFWDFSQWQMTGKFLAFLSGRVFQDATGTANFFFPHKQERIPSFQPSINAS